MPEEPTVFRHIAGALERDWSLIARSNQLPSGAKDGAQTVVEEIEEHALIATLLALLTGIFIGMLMAAGGKGRHPSYVYLAESETALRISAPVSARSLFTASVAA
jgi:hypothetical protein